MPEVFKKKTVRYTLNGKRVTAKTAGAVRTVELSRKWYGTVNGSHVPLCSNKGKAQKMLAARINNAALASVGLADPFEVSKKKSLDDHLKDYGGHLEAKGNTKEHISLTVANVTAFLKGCEFLFTTDVDAGRAEEWLAGLRRDKPVCEIPPGDSFRPADVARLFGVTVGAIRASIKRHGFAAIGNGKARRDPRATVEALAARMSRGVSPETVNHYIRSVRGFFRWLVKAKRIGSNPFESLTLVNAAVDVRRTRRELTANELRNLFAVTWSSPRSYRGLTGPDRFHLYLTAAGTGFRAKALANLTPEDFDLNEFSPIVTLPARFNKSRKVKVQPIPGDVAEQLRGYLKRKPKAKPMWDVGTRPTRRGHNPRRFGSRRYPLRRGRAGRT